MRCWIILIIAFILFGCDSAGTICIGDDGWSDEVMKRHVIGIIPIAVSGYLNCVSQE